MAKKARQTEQKQKRREPQKMGTDEVLRRFFPAQMGGLGALKLFDIMEFSTATEERFVRLLGAMLVLVRIYTAEEGMSLQQAVAEVAYRLGVSTATAKRYLQKHAVSIGPFEVEGRRVKLKPWLWSAVQRELDGVRGKDGVEAARALMVVLGRALGHEEGEGDDGYSSDSNALI